MKRRKDTTRSGNGTSNGKSTRGLRARTDAPLRFGIVGLGHFAQNAVLPAFRNTRGKAVVTALFSDDDKKRERLRRLYNVPIAAPYEDFDHVLATGQLDAVYIALPNHLHREYTVRAARAGVHVLCEKPMAVTVKECEEMIRVCKEQNVKLMIAYRLHFEPATLTAISEIEKGRIGEPRYLVSAFSFTLNEDNIRGLPSDRGGGPLHDIGVYCINAARYFLRAEPDEVTSVAGRQPQKGPLADTEEQVSGILRFPEDRLASFTVSFGAADVGKLTVVGTKGSLTLDPAYEYAEGLAMTLETPRGKRERKFPKRDQIGAELVYFADCVRNDREPEPSGWEGLHDVAIVSALLESARSGRTVPLRLHDKRERPSKKQEIARPPTRGPKPLVRVAPPHT